MPVSPRERLTIARVVRVNHAGEYGAIRIYRAQIWIASRRYPDIVPILDEMLRDELEHCDIFRAAMPARNSRPCRVMSLWGNGGLLLGAVTAVMGRKAIWICTAAVEKTVHRHLTDQLAFLRDRDPDLCGQIEAIQVEELSHLHHAEARMGRMTMMSKALWACVAAATEMVIYLSTWGDSVRMARDLAHARRD